VREVVGAQLSRCWANRRLEAPELKWVRTNNYKFHTFRSVHFNPSLSPRPSFRFSEGLVPRLLQAHVIKLTFHSIVDRDIQEVCGSSRLLTALVLKFAGAHWGAVALLTSYLMLNLKLWKNQLQV